MSFAAAQGIRENCSPARLRMPRLLLHRCRKLRYFASHAQMPCVAALAPKADRRDYDVSSSCSSSFASWATFVRSCRLIFVASLLRPPDSLPGFTPPLGGACRSCHPYPEAIADGCQLLPSFVLRCWLFFRPGVFRLTRQRLNG